MAAILSRGRWVKTAETIDMGHNDSGNILRTSQYGYNMAGDAMALCVTRSSAATVLTLQDQ